MRHPELRREATAVIAKAASAVLYDIAVWYLAWGCGGVGTCLVVGSAKRWVQEWCKTFSAEFFDWQIQSKVKFSDWVEHSVDQS